MKKNVNQSLTDNHLSHTNNSTTTATNKVLFGMDSTQLISSVVIPFVVAIFTVVFTVWLTLKLRDRLRVKQVSSLNDQKFNELCELYVERVPDYERVPPDHFKAFFKSEYSSSSRHDFRRRVKMNTVPVHLLLVAQTSHGICGFLKAIFVPHIRCIFIAYVVAAKGNTYEERNVTGKLLSTLFTICKGSDLNALVCEICFDGQSRRHEAKARLFQHYSRKYGMKLCRIDAPYKQPEICSFDTGDCNVTEAELFIAAFNKKLFARKFVTISTYKALVSNIYKHVYLASYSLAEPELTERYRDFLDRISSALFSSIKSNDIELH